MELRGKVILLMFSIGFAIGLAVALWTGLGSSHHHYKSKTLNDSQLLLPIQDCRVDDGFTWLAYTYTGIFGTDVTRHLKYHLTLEAKSFSNIQRKCILMDSSLWEVESEDEWIAIHAGLLLQGTGTYWLNGKVVKKVCSSDGGCNNATNDDRKPEYSVRWLSTSRSSTYSRLLNSDSNNFADESKCLMVQNFGQNLWMTEDCEESHLGLCVKRNCRPE